MKYNDNKTNTNTLKFVTSLDFPLTPASGGIFNFILSPEGRGRAS
jgi:hypothetical protein